VSPLDRSGPGDGWPRILVLGIGMLIALGVARLLDIDPDNLILNTLALVVIIAVGMALGVVLWHTGETLSQRAKANR
jgi:predicted RND superfamily exporter protein